MCILTAFVIDVKLNKLAEETNTNPHMSAVLEKESAPVREKKTKFKAVRMRYFSSERNFAERLHI